MHRFVLAVALAFSARALADEEAVTPAPSESPEAFRVDGSYRLRFGDQSDIPIDQVRGASGPATFDRLGQTRFSLHRLRIEPKLSQKGKFEFGMQLDLLSGLLSSSPGAASDFGGLSSAQRSGSGSALNGFQVRKLYLHYTTPVGLVMLGQMASEWGLGLIANAGDGEENVDFGDKQFGDLVDRVLFATKPLALITGGSNKEDLVLAVGADIVYSDATARLFVDDTQFNFHVADKAYQGLAALRWKGEHEELGVYVARRHQTFRTAASDTLDVTVGDAYFRSKEPFFGYNLTSEGEVTVVSGSTNYLRNVNAATLAVRQAGAVLRAAFGKDGTDGGFELGYASGDTNPFDATASNFSFNRDYKVSLLLFDELVAWQSARSAARLSDPALLGQAPNGINLLPTNGAVTNALYAKPTIHWRPLPRLQLVGAVLWARAVNDPLDVYNSFASGGSRVNAFTAPVGKNYGVELDGGVSYRFALSDPLELVLGLQGGVLLPGDAFTLADGSALATIYGGRARATLTW